MPSPPMRVAACPELSPFVLSTLIGSSNEYAYDTLSGHRFSLWDHWSPRRVAAISRKCPRRWPAGGCRSPGRGKAASAKARSDSAAVLRGVGPRGYCSPRLVACRMCALHEWPRRWSAARDGRARGPRKRDACDIAPVPSSMRASCVCARDGQTLRGASASIGSGRGRRARRRLVEPSIAGMSFAAPANA